MADQGIHPAECGFVDDVSPGKFSNSKSEKLTEISTEKQNGEVKIKTLKTKTEK